MKIRVLGAFGAEGLGQRPTSFLVNDRILIDAGTVGGALTMPEQNRIEHALITHSHLDHVGGLAFLTETLAFTASEQPRREPLTVASLEPVVEALQKGVFNNIAWPDFAQIPPEKPVMKYRTLVEDAEQRVGELWVTPVLVNHTVPTTGFIVHDGSTGFIFSGDTGPTEALWKAARGTRGLRTAIVECAFPNRMLKLAELAGHMTPDRIRRELDKLPDDMPVWIYHIKPQFYDEIAEELSHIDPARITILEQEKTYTL
ncbi:MAG TPA: 3',5'-cyclic-nucleotide phosphodiesterase [Methylomirabilota bacterium]|jgi:cAMP phosphodiesterase|nr:3',5'-cyclic-nucleotide phosphodiesterase [Methylomirabilota bacterium]